MIALKLKSLELSLILLDFKKDQLGTADSFDVWYYPQKVNYLKKVVIWRTDKSTESILYIDGIEVNLHTDTDTEIEVALKKMLKGIP